MSQTRDQQAYQRGIKAARLWKHLKGTILRWDHACVSSARKHKLPGWSGHIPMGMFAVIMLASLVFGGMVIASSPVFVGALFLLISGISSEGVTPIALSFQVTVQPRHTILMKMSM
ncbi:MULTISPECIES: hypothetical protein [Serratia]|uniref:hypothetical protein n=1 Tax=Serratia TaxID=613 RepID=UPI0021AD1890|nr:MULTISPECIES: hypothetical protein [Serratia]MDI9110334.1 hypothetical protein [Serratia marcescens]MDR8536427.1 hypothetical protein [Serratia nevei]